MTSGSDSKNEEVGTKPISAKPSAGPGSMMTVGFDEGDEDNVLVTNVAEVRKVIRQELSKLSSRRR